VQTLSVNYNDNRRQATRFGGSDKIVLMMMNNDDDQGTVSN